MNLKKNPEERKIKSQKTAKKSFTDKSIYGSHYVKSLELLHLILVFLVIFLTVALISYNPFEGPDSDRIGRSGGILGQFGNIVAGTLMLLTCGRFGAFVVPGVMLVILLGWWSRDRKKPLSFERELPRIGFGIVTLAFYIGFGIAVFRMIKGLPSDLELTGFIPLKLAELSIGYLKPVGTVLVSVVLAIAFLVVLADLRFRKVFPFVVIELPVTVIGFFRNLFVSDRKSDKSAAKSEEATDYQEYADGNSELEEPEIIPASIVKPLPTLESFDPDPIESECGTAKIEQAKRTSRKKYGDGPVIDNLGTRKLPPISLLAEPPDDQGTRINRIELEENSRLLEEKLASLKIEAKVIGTVPGPVITRYDLKPAPEVKIAKIANSADDIAMALSARGVRILAPIPGAAAVGVEIPNREPKTVYMREVVNSDQFRSHRSPLTIALGKNASGEIFCTDLAKAPHLLIAGATGSGKSVCINGIITSILYRSDPKDVRMVLIDPKKIELSLYSRLSEQHLITPRGLGENVVTTPENAVKTLQSVHIEMQRRYDILAEAGVRGLDEYNRWIERTTSKDPEEEETREHLPYIVVIIDELADLMMVLRREFEELIVRLAQMARAVGIHLIVATQRPSVDVVTGLIKANFPSRITFKVASKFDSRTIIDSMGAETLLGRGDMLYMGPGASQLMRLHGALITTDEVERIVEFVHAQPPCTSKFELPDPEVERVRLGPTGNAGSDRDSFDVLFEEAAKIVVNSKQGSISVLQRRLRVGYARAARLIDELEQVGIVGPFDGSKAREVTCTPEDLREVHGII